MTKDYYKILEISEFSTQEEIKSAYRKLARKWHPDIAGNSQDIINRFKEINEAYEFLSNSVKRYDYDKARKFYDYARASKAFNESETETKSKTQANFKETYTENKKQETHEDDNKHSGFNFNWEKFFKDINLSSENGFNKNKESVKSERKETPQRGNDVYTDIEINIMEAVNGTTKIVNMLQTTVCPKCGGRKFINGTTCSKCHGKGDIAEYKRFNVRIPAGIKHKSKIRLSGEGEKGSNGGRNGDLYLIVNIKEEKGYRTEGKNVYKDVSILPFQAVLGANIVLETPIGKVNLKISPNTQNGQKIRLSGCGLEDFSKRGDMIVTVLINIPKNLSKEEIELYKKLEKLYINSDISL